MALKMEELVKMGQESAEKGSNSAIEGPETALGYGASESDTLVSRAVP